jgi:hypothetical protein
MKAHLTTAFFSELLIAGCAVTSFSPIDSEYNLYKESDEMYADEYRTSEWKKKISPKNLR